MKDEDKSFKKNWPFVIPVVFLLGSIINFVIFSFNEDPDYLGVSVLLGLSFVVLSIIIVNTADNRK